MSRDVHHRLKSKFASLFVNLIYFCFRGIAEGFQDGLAAGRIEGLKEGFREGFKSGSDFGIRIGNSMIPLIQIIQNSQDSHKSEHVTAMKLLTEIGSISLSNDEDPQKESRVSQIEAKIKALTVNFSKKTKNLNINRINKHEKDELSF